MHNRPLKPKAGLNGPPGLLESLRMKQKIRTLIYKRTHKGDPDANGYFGIEDCMGSVRRRGFDAVIGVGGISSEPRSQGIDRKVNWVGVGPRKTPLADGRGPLVSFERFVLLEEKGPDFTVLAPHLAHRMLTRNARVIFDSFSENEQEEIETILKLARKFASTGRVPTRTRNENHGTGCSCRRHCKDLNRRAP